MLRIFGRDTLPSTQLDDEITVKHPELGSEWQLDVMNEQTPYKPVIGFTLERLVPGELFAKVGIDEVGA